MFGRQQRRTNFPKRSGSGYSSWPESDSEDDIITPCAASEKPEATVTMTEYAPAPAGRVVEHAAAAAHPRSSLADRRASLDDVNLEELWACMLDLQRTYRCYNSTRMEIAADSDDAMDMMPTRACMDMLNDSIDVIPEEGWKKLKKFLCVDSEACYKPPRWQFWKNV